MSATFNPTCQQHSAQHVSGIQPNMSAAETVHAHSMYMAYLISNEDMVFRFRTCCHVTGSTPNKDDNKCTTVTYANNEPRFKISHFICKSLHKMQVYFITMHLHIFEKEMAERLTCKWSQGLSLSNSMSIGMWLDWLTHTNHWLSKHLTINHWKLHYRSNSRTVF